MVTKTVKELAEHVGGQVEGDESVEIAGAATLSEAKDGDVSFLANLKYEKELLATKASVVVIGEKVDISKMRPEREADNGGGGKGSLVLIRSRDPYYAFMQIVVLLHGYREHESIGISERASVASSSKIGDGVDIHDFVVISADAEIGANTRIYPNSTIGPGSKIGADCIIYPNVTVYDGCTIGDRVTIHSGSVIGQDGFGYATHDGEHHKIPQIGGVVIEDDVEIGANCAIDRGTLGDTVVGRGSKLSNLIAIGHNTKVGPNCLLVAQVGIAGSTNVGESCVFGGQVGVVGHIKIGDKVHVGAQAGVINDVPNGMAVVGSPAQPITQAKRSLMLLKDLPEFRKKLKEMDRTIRQIMEGEEGNAANS